MSLGMRRVCESQVSNQGLRPKVSDASGKTDVRTVNESVVARLRSEDHLISLAATHRDHADPQRRVVVDALPGCAECREHIRPGHIAFSDQGSYVEVVVRERILQLGRRLRRAMLHTFFEVAKAPEHAARPRPVLWARLAP